MNCLLKELTDRLEGMKVAHQDEKQDYEQQLTELRSEYTKTKDELDGEIMVRQDENDIFSCMDKPNHLKLNKIMNFISFFLSQNKTGQTRVL